MLVSDLTPNGANPRKISKEQLARLEKSLREFGDLGCIILNRKTNRLVGGHQRAKVLPQDAKIEITDEYLPPTPTGTTAEGYVTINQERFAFRIVDWEEDKELAANISANQSGGDFDIPVLNDILLHLDEVNYDMDLTGFGRDEIENLMAPLPKEDETEENKEEKEKKMTPVTCPNCQHLFMWAP